MDIGTKIPFSIPCLVCNTLVNGTDNQSLSSSSSCYSDDQKNISLFLLRNLLEIPKQLVGDKSKEDNGQISINSCSKFVVACEQCQETIKQASLIYGEIRLLAHKFRGIQKKIVEALKTCGDSGGPEVLDVVEHYRKLVNDCDFNGFGFPFVVQDEEEADHEEVAASSTNYGSCSFTGGVKNDVESNRTISEVVVKQEEETSGNQEILLFFPEGEEEEEDDDDDQVSQTDSEGGEEEDSDYHCSDLNSEEEDVGGQVSQDDLESEEVDEDDQTSQMDSEEEEEDEEQNVNPVPANNLLSSFICKICMERFSTKAELDAHDKITHFKEETGKFPCPLEGCTETYTYAGIFPRHFRVHHRYPPFICKDCKQEFSNLDQARIHHKQNHPPLQLPINTPQKNKQETKLAIRKTVKKSHKARKRRSRKPAVPPKPRGRPRKTPGQEKSHQQPKKFNGKRCNPDNPFPCPHCPYRLKTFFSLKTHLKTAHPNSPIPLNELRLKFYTDTCPITEPSLPEVRKSAKHSHGGKVPTFERQYPHLTCTKNPEGKYACPWTDPCPCPRIFIRKPTLYQHIQVHHLNLTLFTCTWSEGQGEGEWAPVCGRSFATRHNYLEHYDEHRGTPKYKCEECGMTFYRRNPFKRHQQKMHSDEKFICEICGQGFSCREYLNMQMTLKHKDKPSKDKQGAVVQEGEDEDAAASGIICNLCGKLLKNLAMLKLHIKRVHENDDDEGSGIICDLCGQLLKNRDCLKVHVQNKHDKIPGKHCCHLCDNRYRVITHLNMHLWERHQFKVEGFKPKEKVARKDKFQCPVVGCRMVLIKKENLEKHRKRFHGEDGRKPGPFNCKYCGKNFFQKIKWQHCEKVHENKERRPEKCEVCGKGFPTKDHLRFHQRHTHKMQLEDSRGWRKKKLDG